MVKFPPQGLIQPEALTLSFSYKESVRVATTAAQTLASEFENGDTIDGIVLATGDRILIKDQAAGDENGIYTVNASGAPTRSTDADTANDLLQAAVWIQEGTVNEDTGYVLTTDAPITVDTTALVFVQFTGTGTITAGTGLTKTANTINAIGTSGKIVANANSITIGTDVVDITKTNVFGDFDQTFKDNRILIESPDGLTPITLVNLQQTLARNLTIPILLGNDTFATLGLAQTFSGFQTFSANLTMSAADVLLAGNKLNLSAITLQEVSNA